MQVRVDADPPTLTVRVGGELDLARVERLRRLLPHEEDADVSSVILDLSSLTFCDCTGLRALAQLRAAHVALGRSVSVTGIQPRVRRLMTICGVDDPFLA